MGIQLPLDEFSCITYNPPMDPQKALETWLEDRKITQADFARRIEYDRGNFNKILSGALWPTLELALKIEKATNGSIPMSAWAEAKAA